MVITPGLTVILAVVAVIATVLIVTAVVVVIVAHVFTSVIIAVLVVGGAGSLFSFFGVGVPICYLYQFANGSGPLAVQLSMELLVLEPFGEGNDGFGIDDVGNGVSFL